MSGFTQAQGWCRPVAGIRYVTISALSWEIGHLGSGHIYTVPAGTAFDCSIPRCLRWLLDPHDTRFLKASAIHDHMLVAGWDRPTAGGVFHAALKAAGVGSAKRLAMFFAVTIWKWA